MTLRELEEIIRQKASAQPQDSYTAWLLDAGVPTIAQKVGEEAVEAVIEAVRLNRTRFCEEAADLLYHLVVLCRACGVSLDDIEAVLASRHRSPGERT